MRDLIARATELNEQELWREMVRWSGGVVHEEDGLLLVAGPSRYLRVAMRLNADVDAANAVERVTEYFDSEHILLVRTPQEADLEDAAVARGYRPEWTELPMVLTTPPQESSIPTGSTFGRSSTRAACPTTALSSPKPTTTPVSANARRCFFTTRCSSHRTGRRSSHTPTTNLCHAR